MKLDGFMNRFQYLVARFANRDAARKVWHVRTKGRRPFFDNDKVTHRTLLFLQSSLFQRAVKGSWRYVNARFSRHGDSTRLRSMMELPVATFRSNLEPTIFFEQSD
jgi:hypothetical protein